MNQTNELTRRAFLQAAIAVPIAVPVVALAVATPPPPAPVKPVVDYDLLAHTLAWAAHTGIRERLVMGNMIRRAYKPLPTASYAPIIMNDGRTHATLDHHIETSFFIPERGLVANADYAAAYLSAACVGHAHYIESALCSLPGSPASVFHTRAHWNRASLLIHTCSPVPSGYLSFVPLYYSEFLVDCAEAELFRNNAAPDDKIMLVSPAFFAGIHECPRFVATATGAGQCKNMSIHRSTQLEDDRVRAFSRDAIVMDMRRPTIPPAGIAIGHLLASAHAETEDFGLRLTLSWLKPHGLHCIIELAYAIAVAIPGQVVDFRTAAEPALAG